MVKGSKCELIFVIDYTKRNNYYCLIYGRGYSKPIYYISNLPKEGVYFATELKGTKECIVTLLNWLPTDHRDKKQKIVKYNKKC